MTLINLARRAEKLAADNSPAILSGIAIVGTLTTAYLTGKATIRAYEITVDTERNRHFAGEQNITWTPRERIELCWKEYLPAAGSALVTVASIITAVQIGNRRAAALAAAYTISERAYSEYRDKVVEKFGEVKERQVKDEIAQDRINDNPPTGNQVLPTEGQVLCFDKYNGRYFSSTVEDIKKAQNDTNYEILHNNYASLNDFYSKLGLELVSAGEELGWNSDHLLEVTFSSILSDNNTPVLVMDFYVAPIRGHYKSW